MTMNSRSHRSLYSLIVIIVIVFTASIYGAAASRMMSSSFCYENLKNEYSDRSNEEVMAMWMVRLPSGPGKRGAGH
ncbi:hypothetical protein AXF42_Ash000586 [Apostasia shenzhenica]|uniref:Transmembrane protein n=1 Tax=Apostasia shenzhenica TaxID=1088818 RepID=A0A2I0AGR5_9ASPA|nr:hypothetical protein AXF42_Ash000586 [Apostasia shenzhenica]